MTIPLFSGNAGRSLLIRRGTDSYGEEGRRQEVGGRKLEYGVGFSARRNTNTLTLIARNSQPALDEVSHVRS
ncbi:hypothetical protein [Nostoc sp. 'Peltigera membranacea cyanobiont' 210A]|uniref:hypothetical protein n=1 Tax=Nostoc sp. 'Peltigera membranacea cyanobiont' 210A TaxID=2014529 RepID=UPI0011807FA0|nr:hypothetical protein [Nostoc sp. 'Peltigera membranacea cyanobiont' 210A]